MEKASEGPDRPAAPAGLAAPAIVGTAAASGILTSMITGAVLTGAVSGGAYLAVNVATGREVSLSGFAASFATGAFLGAVGSVAGMAGGSIAKFADSPATGFFARSVAGLINFGAAAGSSIGESLKRGEGIDWTGVLISAGLAYGSSASSESMLRGLGRPARSFADAGAMPRSLRVMARVFTNFEGAGLNAKRFVIGTLWESALFEDAVIGFETTVLYYS